MRVAVLGRPAVVSSGDVVSLAGTREAGLLALLTARAGEVVRAAWLENVLWEGHAVSEAALRVAVNRLRKRFLTLTGVDPLRSEPAGYFLDLAQEDVDANVYEGLVNRALRAGTRGNPAGVVELVERGEQLWRGDAYDGFGHLQSVGLEQDRLSELRWSALELRAAAIIDIGDPASALVSMNSVVAQSPLRESARALQMAALAHLGRERDAIAAFDELQSLLHDEFGTTPSAELFALAQAITDQQPPEELLRATLAGRAPSHSIRAAAPAHLVGRDEALARLRSAAAPGSPVRLVAVVGEPGIGKTALTDAFLDEHRERGATGVHGRCGHNGEIPLQAFFNAFAGITGEPGSAIGAELAALFGERPQPFDFRSEPLDLRRLRVMSLFADLVATLSASGPVVVVLDDADAIDQMSLSLVDHLVSDCIETPLLIVLNHRSGDFAHSPGGELVAELAGSGRTDVVQLERLTAQQTAELVNADTGTDAAALHRVAGGNPLYAIQLHRFLTEHSSDVGSVTGELPPDLAQLCTARLERLSAAALQFLEAAAVRGEVVSANEVAAMLGVSRLDLSPSLTEVRSAGLVEPAEGFDRFAFVHGLIRTACYSRLEPARRAHLHLAAARIVAGSGDAQRSEVTVHLAEARPLAPDAEIADAALAAGAEAVQLGDHQVANRFFRLVLELRSPTAAQVSAARYGFGLGLAADGDHLESEATLSHAVAEACAAGEWTVAADSMIARTRLGLVATIPEALNEANTVDRILSELPPTETRRRAHLLFWSAELLMNIEPERSAAAITEGRELADELGDTFLQGLFDYARIRLDDSTLRDPATCVAAAEALRDLAAGRGHSEVAARSAILLQFSRMRCGHLAAALDDHSSVEASAAAAAEPGLGLQARLLGAALEIASAPMKEADRRSDAASTDPPPGLENLALVSRFVQLTVIRREQLRLAELEPLLVISLASSPRRLGRPLVAAGRVEQQDLKGAEEQLALFGEELPGLRPDWIYLATLAFAAEVVAELGYSPLVEPLEQRLAAEHPQVVVGSALIVVGHIDRYLGLLAHRRGDLDLAIARLEHARTTDNGNGLPLWSAWSAHGEAAARLERGTRGDRTQAAGLLAEAARVANAFGSERLTRSADVLYASHFD
jgi:DNA-binding SARP family transcriptional activator